ncbi:MAG TPA: ribbon-helix-helix protein, CopG family [Polyangiaceae bacterium]|nr:ribbon-helix-helix protein, CopG family [Polyangiaceae bacterium]
MKTAISLPDEVFAQAERLARRLRKSRSQLYRDAVSEFITRHDPDAVTEAMDRAMDQVEATPDEFARTAARRVLARTEW